jgi:hypothetical protein
MTEQENQRPGCVKPGRRVIAREEIAICVAPLAMSPAKGRKIDEK